MKVVYVAGPYRADNAWEIEQNIRRAEELALKVWLLGAAAICPHTNTRFYQGVAPDRRWLDGDLEIVRRCDALVLVPNWTKSVGTQGEVKLANKLEIPVFDDIDGLRMWLLQHDVFPCPKCGTLTVQLMIGRTCPTCRGVVDQCVTSLPLSAAYPTESTEGAK